jgi:hypothetical protein
MSTRILKRKVAFSKRMRFKGILILFKKLAHNVPILGLPHGSLGENDHFNVSATKS